MLRQAQAADQTVAQVCKEHGISEQTWYRWKSKYSRMEIAEVRPFQAFAAPTLQRRNPRYIQYCVRESYGAHSYWRTHRHG
jgi:transposase-like protein